MPCSPTVHAGPHALTCHHCGVLLAPACYTTALGFTCCGYCYHEGLVREVQDFVFFGPEPDNHLGEIFINICVKQVIDEVFPFAKGIMDIVSTAREQLKSGLHDLAFTSCQNAWEKATSDDAKGNVGGDVLFAISLTLAKVHLAAQNNIEAARWACQCLSLSSHVTTYSKTEAHHMLDNINSTMTPAAHTEHACSEALHPFLHRMPTPTGLAEAMQGPLQCPCCLQVLHIPSTLPTGHTVCRACLFRCLEVTDPHTGSARPPVCPLTRIPLTRFAEWVNSHPPAPSVTRVLDGFLNRYCLAEVEERQRQVAAEREEENGENRWVAIFVCTIAWPGVPCPLHVFEPRYRLMMRRALELGQGEFGMCSYEDGGSYTPIGTICKIRSCKTTPDGRLFVDAIGVSRFRVKERGQRDGYHVAKIELLLDEDDLLVPIDPANSLALARRQMILETSQNMYRRVQEWVQGRGPRLQGLLTGHYGDVPQDAFLLSMWLCAVLLGESPDGAYRFISGVSLNTRLQSLRPLVSQLCKRI